MTRSTRARSAKGGAVPQYGGNGQLEHRLAVVRARALAAGAVGLVLFALLAGYFLSRPATYTVTSVLSVRPADSRTNDQVVTLLLSRYTAVGQSRQTLAAAAQTAGVSTDTLLNGTAVLNPPLTANIRITVSLRDATAAAAAANAITATVLQAAAQDGLVSAGQVERAAPAGATSGAGYALKLALALIVGLVGAAATASIGEARRPRLRTRQQLRRLADVPVPLWLTSLPGRAQRRVHTSTADERDAIRLRAVVCSRVPAGVDADGQRLVLVMSPYEATRARRWAQSLATSLADDGRPVLLVEATGPRARARASALTRRRAGRPDGRPARQGLAAGVHHEQVSLAAHGPDDDGPVGARGLGAYLRAHAQGYAHVVVEAGPLLGEDVALVLAPSCHAVVLLLAVGDRVDETEEALTLCQELRIANLVLCGVDFP